MPSSDVENHWLQQGFSVARDFGARGKQNTLGTKKPAIWLRVNSLARQRWVQIKTFRVLGRWQKLQNVNSRTKNPSHIGGQELSFIAIRPNTATVGSEHWKTTGAHDKQSRKSNKGRCHTATLFFAKNPGNRVRSSSNRPRCPVAFRPPPRFSNVCIV